MVFSFDVKNLIYIFVEIINVLIFKKLK